jgi:hypothetical protein
MKRIFLPTVFLMLAACSGGTPSSNEEFAPHPEYFDVAVPKSLQDVFDKPDRAQLFTVITSGDIEVKLKDPKLKELPRLHDWYIVGEAGLSADETARLKDSFKEAVIKGEFNGMMCFFPHHVLRLVKGRRTLDLVVCFQCRNFEVLPEGGRNNVVFSDKTGMEKVWRQVVADHKMKDYSLEFYASANE